MRTRKLFGVLSAFLLLASLALAGTMTRVRAEDSTPADVPKCEQPNATPPATPDPGIAATAEADEHAEGDPEAEEAATSTVISTEQPVCSITIEMVDIAYKPNVVTIPAGQAVQIVFPNTGHLPHDFTQDQLGLDIDVDSGETKTIVVNVPAGDYDFYCDEPGHAAAGMVGTMHVVEQ